MGTELNREEQRASGACQGLRRAEKREGSRLMALRKKGLVQENRDDRQGPGKSRRSGDARLRLPLGGSRPYFRSILHRWVSLDLPEPQGSIRY